jgi:hypothetical protein
MMHRSTAMATTKTPNPITMYNTVSESGGIHRSAAYMKTYDSYMDEKRHRLYAKHLDIIHFVKDMFIPTKKYTKDDAKHFMKSYTSVINIKKHGIWHLKRLLLENTNPKAKTSHRGWNIHYQIEQSIEELMRLEFEFKMLVRGARSILDT